MSSLQVVARLDELWIGETRACRVRDQALLIARLDSGVVACRDRCPHQGYPLSRGRLDGDTLTCALHHWQFDLASGRGINPACARLERLPVRIRDGTILVDLQEPEHATG